MENLVTYIFGCVDCNVSLGTVQLEEGKPHPGNAFFGMLCETCAQRREMSALELAQQQVEAYKKAGE